MVNSIHPSGISHFQQGLNVGGCEWGCWARLSRLDRCLTVSLGDVETLLVHPGNRGTMHETSIKDVMAAAT